VLRLRERGRVRRKQMKRLLVIAAAVSSTCATLVLAVAGTALAHAEISPSEVPAGASEEFTLEALQEKGVPTTEVRMEVPEGFEVTGVPPSGGWKGEVGGGAVVWSGGKAPQEGMGIDLAFEARTPEEAGDYAFRVIQTYEDGTVVRWDGAEDSDEPAAFVVVSSGGSGGGASHEGHEHEHGDEAETLSDTGGLDPALLGAAGALMLAAVGLALLRAVKRS
jgi:uncharacterized protein YcnI